MEEIIIIIIISIIIIIIIQYNTMRIENSKQVR
jgi:hypothetical protein